MALLCLVMASRFTRLNDFETDRDELLSIQRAQADTFENLLLWLPNDWPPLYFALLGVWEDLVGLHPVHLRVSSALLSLFAFALMYRVGRRIGGERAGILAMLAYAALSYGIVIDLKLRGYVIIHALIPALLWLTMRYFERPHWRRALLLGLCMAVMFYTTYISALMFFVIGAFSLIMYGKQVWRWWLPGVFAGALALPEALRKLDVAVDVATAEQPGQTLIEALLGLFQGWTGFYSLVWAGLLLVALLALLRRGRWLLVFAVWIVAIPAAMYFLLDPRFTFTQRYSFWAMGGIALLVGWGWSRLPRPLYGLACAACAVIMFAPVPQPDFFTFPYTQTFGWLRGQVQTGDVFVIDPRCDCPQPRELNFYIRLYFPHQGLQLVDDPADHRRVWYVSGGGIDEPTFNRVRDGRVSQQFFGPSSFLFQLYEAPPDPVGIAFENGMRFHGVDILDPYNNTPWFGEYELMENQPVRLRLWWSADAPIPADYSIATYITRGERTRAQFDGPPQLIDPDAPRETSRWRTGRYYVEERVMTLPRGETRDVGFTLALTVYQWWDNVRIPGEGTDEAGLLPLGDVRVKTS